LIARAAATNMPLMLYSEIIQRAILVQLIVYHGRFSGLVVRDPDYRYRGPCYVPQRYQILVVVGQRRGQLSLVGITEELFERKVASPI
jgi:hypothetical protein